MSDKHAGIKIIKKMKLIDIGYCDGIKKLHLKFLISI